MNVRRSLFGLVLLFCGWAGTPPAFGQTGAAPISKADLARIPKWVPPEMGVGEVPWVDMRGEMPPVGSQSRQNSCVGWAVAYATMSHLEGQANGWQPDRETRIFSPAFVYNQLNHGLNRGTRIDEAFEVLKHQGCATLATMPYRPGDWISQPSEEARQEAAGYRILGFQQIDTPGKIRSALQQHLPVTLLIQTDPTFRSGAYHQFTLEHRRDGLSRMTPDDPHGYHAMVAVGYDDANRAFILMNSWGRNWGQGGYCQVSYDVMARIEPEGDNFCYAAFVPLGVVPPRRQAGEVSAAAEGWYMGTVDGKPTWGWKAHLVATPEVLATVTGVDWSAPAAESDRSIQGGEAGNGFEVSGRLTRAGTYRVTGTVQFAGGDRRTVQAEVRLEAARAANLKLAQTSRFWGTKDGRAYHEISVRLEGSLAELTDVQEVTYHLPEGAANRDPVVRNPETGFRITIRTPVPFTLGATVQLRSGGTTELQLPLKVAEELHNELRLTNTARVIGEDDGLRIFNWTASIVGPAEKLHQVKLVRYFLHPTFDRQTVDVVQGEEFGFPLSATGWGTFTLKARVYFKDGSTVELSHMLRFQTEAPAPEPIDRGRPPVDDESAPDLRPGPKVPPGPINPGPNGAPPVPPLGPQFPPLGPNDPQFPPGPNGPQFPPLGPNGPQFPPLGPNGPAMPPSPPKRVGG